MSNEKVFPKGVFGFAKNEKAPIFVIGTLVITPRELVDWLNADGKQYLTEYKDKKQLKLQITEGRDGKLNIAVDTFIPKERTDFSKVNTNAVGKVDNFQDLPF
jgi:hypothetical protein